MAYCSGASTLAATGSGGGGAAQRRAERLGSPPPRRRRGATGGRRWPGLHGELAARRAAPPTSGRRRRGGRAPTAGWRWRTRGRGRRPTSTTPMSPPAKRSPGRPCSGAAPASPARSRCRSCPPMPQPLGASAAVSSPVPQPRSTARRIGRSLDQLGEVPERLRPLGGELRRTAPGPRRQACTCIQVRRRRRGFTARSPDRRQNRHAAASGRGWGPRRRART